MPPESDDGFGFSFRPNKGGDVTIFRNGQTVTVLRGASARNFLAKARGASLTEQQQLTARITGNYKRGNERLASSHTRNRRQNDA
jgi:hypothetical protein